MTESRWILPVLIACLVAACASTPLDRPEPRPLGRDPAATRAPEAPAVPTGESAPSPSGVLALRDALEAALAGNPGLAAAAWDVRAAEGRQLQASLYPNPELDFEVEEFGGTGELSGFDSATYTWALSQEIPLGGKIGKETAVARVESRLAAWEYEEARLDVLTETTKSFIEVLAAQELVGIAGESVRLGEGVLRAAREQVEAGKAARIEESQAAVALSLARLELLRAKQDLASARRALAARWGEAGGGFDAVTGDLSRTRRLPPEALVRKQLAESPALARWSESLELHRARAIAAEAGAWPDLTVTGGVQRLGESDVTAFLAGVSLPLPVFDRNQGSVAEALAEAARNREEHRKAVLDVETDFADAWQGLGLAIEEAETLRDSVVPAAQAAFDASREGFRQGKFGYLYVLDSQQTLIEAKEQLVEALAAYHTAVADVEGLIGRSLSSLEQQ